MGLRVAEDCSIVGFDNHEMIAPYLDPGLTTMELPYEQMARQALSILLNDVSEAPKQTPVECSLILRGSVASAKVRA